MNFIKTTSNLAISISIVQYFGEYFNQFFGNYLPYVLSFSAGISLTYIFIDLFPYFTSKAIFVDDSLFILLLLGFALINLIEKHIYQYSIDKNIKKEFLILNQISSISYYFIIGILVYTSIIMWSWTI
jgi:hypothetical protein